MTNFRAVLIISIITLLVICISIGMLFISKKIKSNHQIKNNDDKNNIREISPLSYNVEEQNESKRIHNKKTVEESFKEQLSKSLDSDLIDDLFKPDYSNEKIHKGNEFII